MAQTLHARHTRDTDTDTRATAVNTMAWFILTAATHLFPPIQDYPTTQCSVRRPLR